MDKIAAALHPGSIRPDFQRDYDGAVAGETGAGGSIRPDFQRDYDKVLRAIHVFALAGFVFH